MAKRLKAAERKASILAVAKVLFADKGYHGVSVDEIAKRLGVSPAILYQHFPSKEVLYEEVLAENSAKRESYIEAILTEPSDFISALRRMTMIYVENVSRDTDFLRMELMSALEGSKTASAFFERRWHAITDYIEYSLAELNKSAVPSPVNPRMAGLMYQGMLREILYNRFIIEDSRYQDVPLNIMIDELIKMFARAIGREFKA
ncbi:MAG: TetR family transcriptional regulator [Gammaproteobacteria bacterium]|nr:TetR family transcriptional regulator [Gammaproteobacteria bacterium]